VHNTDAESLLKVVKLVVPPQSSILYTDEWRVYNSVTEQLHIAHSTVRHSLDAFDEREWARDDDGDGKREVHCNSLMVLLCALS
jgi:transposase